MLFLLLSSIKLLKITDLYNTVHEEVNGLLSEHQLDYVCKVLANTGKVCNISIYTRVLKILHNLMVGRDLSTANLPI